MTGSTPWVAQDQVEPIQADTIGAIANSALFNTISGCAGSYSGANLNVTIASGSITHNGTVTSVAGNSVALVADATNPRWSYIYINSSGVAAIVSGTAAATPGVPDFGANVTNQLVYVQAGLTIASNATYQLVKRVMAAVTTATAAIYGSDTNEVTATSGVASDYVTISNLSIPAGKPFRVKFLYRKSSGAAVAAAFGLKINSTVVREAAAAAVIPRTSATNQAESGIAWFDVYPGETNYITGVMWFYQCYDAALGTTLTASSIGDGSPAALSAACPVATVTSITIRGIGNGSMTTGVKNVFVEAI